MTARRAEPPPESIDRLLHAIREAADRIDALEARLRARRREVASEGNEQAHRVQRMRGREAVHGVNDRAHRARGVRGRAQRAPAPGKGKEDESGEETPLETFLYTLDGKQVRL